MEIAYRYGEQIETTVETMRRRCLAIYDGTIRIGKRSAKVVDRFREYAEPIAYDANDALANALYDLGSLDASERDFRNNILELYLSCSVLSIGLSAGEIAGSLVLGMVYEKIFDWWMELLLVFMLPYHLYLNFRKNAALDETERRVNLFGLALSVGSIMGHLMGYRLISTLPAVNFVQPLILAITVDPELSPTSIYSRRETLLAAGAGAGCTLALMLALIHGLSFAIILAVIEHALFLTCHFQVVIYAAKTKTFGAMESQMCYIIGSLLLQIPTALIFGRSTP